MFEAMCLGEIRDFAMTGLATMRHSSDMGRRPHVGRSLALLQAGVLVLALAGCGTTGSFPGSDNPGYAELQPASAATTVDIDSLSRVIAAHPRDADAYNTRGVAYARIGSYDRAVRDFSVAVRLDPHNAPAFTNRALAERQMGNNRAAMRDFSAAINVNSNHAPAYLGRANLLRSQGELQPAMNDLDHIIAIHSGVPQQLRAQAYHAKGLIDQRLGNQQQAITDFSNAIDSDPFAAAPYLARGQSYIAVGNFKEAVGDFNSSLNVDAKNPVAWDGLGLARERMGQKSKALEAYQGALALDPNDPVARRALGRLQA